MNRLSTVRRCPGCCMARTSLCAGLHCVVLPTASIQLPPPPPPSLLGCSFRCRIGIKGWLGVPAAISGYFYDVARTPLSCLPHGFPCDRWGWRGWRNGRGRLFRRRELREFMSPGSYLVHGTARVYLVHSRVRLHRFRAWMTALSILFLCAAIRTVRRYGNASLPF